MQSKKEEEGYFQVLNDHTRPPMFADVSKEVQLATNRVHNCMYVYANRRDQHIIGIILLVRIVVD